MKRMILFALVLNAALRGVIAHQLVAIAGDGPEAAQNGDTNGDGQRDVSDAIHLLSWLFLGGQEPVPVACAQAGGMLSPEQEEILSHMSIVELPVDVFGNSVRTIRFSGVNVQVVNGTGATDGPGNGHGNLVVGYQELREDDGNDEANDRNLRSGSHNLVVGKANNYSSWGGQVVGERNTLSGYLSIVSGGYGNTARDEHTTVGGGYNNTALGDFSVVSGGRNHTADGEGEHLP